MDPDLDINSVTVLVNISNGLDGFLDLVFIIFYLIGFIMALVGVVMLFSEDSNGQSMFGHGKMNGATYLISGTLLLALVQSVSIFTNTIFGENSGVVALMITTGLNPNDDLARILFTAAINLFVVIGWMAIGRGYMFFGRAGSRRNEGGAKGIYYILSGIFLVHITAIGDLIANSVQT